MAGNDKPRAAVTNLARSGVSVTNHARWESCQVAFAAIQVAFRAAT